MRDINDVIAINTRGIAEAALENPGCGMTCATRAPSACAERLRSIRDEMLAIETKDFSEISDRGGNFDYLEPAREEMLKVFFGWFAEASGELETVSLDAPEAARAIAKELAKQ
jgi:hypothetical protein